MDDLRWASAVTQARLLRDGSVSAAELRADAIATIERLDPVLHAVVIPLFDRRGDGVPMLVKDAGQELAGTSHWVGVAALRDAGSRSVSTTALAMQFERAGFSIVGKGACAQLANGATTEPPGFEPTRNPWDLTRSAGGSSGGSAAAVASGMVAVAHGSDATGSLRCPAALCGVATLNPSAGRIRSVPPAGQPTNAAWRDFVLARHSEDLGAVFAALTGARPAPSTGTLRIGILDHDPELGLRVDPDCAAGARVAGAHLEALGHHLDGSWPDALNRFWSQAGTALAITSDAVRRPVIEWVSGRLGRPVARDELDARVFDGAERDAARDRRDIQAAHDTIAGAVALLADWWDDHDVLVTPCTFQPAWSLGGNPGPSEMGTLLAPFSLSGQPSLSLPLHRSVDGLPIGVQLVGRRGADELLLRLAEDLQAAADWTVHRPALV